MLPLLLLGRLLLRQSPINQKARVPRSELTVERTLSGEFNGRKSDDQGEWRLDSKSVLVTRPSKNRSNGTDIVEVNPLTGKSKVLVPAEKLIPEGSTVPLTIDQYSLSSDDKHLLIFTNSQRVWRQNTRGDYWHLDLQSGRLSKLGGHASPASLMFAKISPDGTRVGYVSNNNLFVQDLLTLQVTAVTKDGTEKVINGTSDWVYEEELDVRDGWRWSPDGKQIAFWQIDSSPESIYSLINDTDTLYPQIRKFPYPKSGQTNPTVRIGVVSAAGGVTTWMKEVADDKSGYISRMNWTPDGDNLLLQHLNRRQNENKYILANPVSGGTQVLFTDSDTTWVDILDTGDSDVRWMADGKSFLVLSEKDGWRHLYLVSSDSGATKLLTPGKYDVDSVQGLNEDAGLVYFMASPDNSTQRYLFSVSYRDDAKPTRLTPETNTGTNQYDISPDGKSAFHSWSQFSEPTETELISLPDHRVLKMLEDGKDVKSKISSLHLGPSKLIQLKAADGTMMDVSLILPPDFDEKRRYPVLFNVYGEPAGAIVQDAWDGGHLFDELIAQHGYIVAAADNRGTPTIKGRTWRKSVYRKIGVIASEDQAAAVKQLDKLPYIDATRIGIWGWSGGGTMTLNMLFRYPELYHLGMSVAPVPDMHLYDTIYQERYMGLPQENEADYVAGSPITHAKGLAGELLIVHGSADDNVHYQGTERLINKLVELDKPFQLMVYPNRTHAISEGPGTRLHLYKLLLKFLLDKMPP